MARVPRVLRAIRSRARAQAPPPTAPVEEPENDADSGDDAVEILVATSLFDEVWYALCADRELTRREAVEHYLHAGRARGLTPHPLFDPACAAAALDLDADAPRGDDQPVEDPLVVYVRDRRFEVAVHPLFDLDLYVTENPGAADHADGPLGHYREVGAPSGARPNRWYRPDPAAEPAGLETPIVVAATAWAHRRRSHHSMWGPPKAPPITDEAALPVAGSGLTSIVLVVENPEADLARSVDSVLAQTTSEWELIVAAVGTPIADPAPIPDDPRIHVIEEPAPTSWAARNRGLARARGRHVAWMSAGDRWSPGRLSALHRALQDSGSSWAHDGAEAERSGQPPRAASRRMRRELLLAGHAGELSTVIVSTDAARAAGGFDESLQGGQTLEFLLRISADAEGGFAPGLGVSMQLERNRAWQPHAFDRPWVDHDGLASATDAVLNRHLVDWQALTVRPPDDGLVTVVIPTYDDWEATERAVRGVVEARGPGPRVEVVVIDNGSGLVPATILSTFPQRYDGVRVVPTYANHGTALGNNIGLGEARGATVVFLANNTEVTPGWLEPLVGALRDRGVLASQSLLIGTDGTIRSAGMVFPRGGGLPHALLESFPAEDAEGMEALPLRALSGGALAVRFADLVAVRGFDPIFRNGMEDVDLCLRLAEKRAGRFTVVPTSQVVHHEPASSPPSSIQAINRRVFLDRWLERLPQDDVEAWRDRGFEVVGHRVAQGGSPDRRLRVADPVLSRRPRVEVDEGTPGLRWAIKNPAPAGPKGDPWGDTHFAEQLARALRALGQNVVVDRMGAFERPSESLDDVVLLLRGLGRYTPLVDRVNLTWLISHPDLVERSAHRGWDRIYVASAPFAERMARDWGAPAVVLPQATDPAVFHPGLAEPDTGEQVLFIGNSRRQPRPLVMAAVEQDLPLRVYGAGWEDLIPARYVAGEFLANDQVGAAYRAARLVLNDHWADMAREGFLSNRLFDAVAAGARVVSDDAAGLEEVFGDAVLVASTAEELAAIARAPDLDALFGNDATRRARAADFAAKHSFDARARTMLEDAVRIRSERGFR